MRRRELLAGAAAVVGAATATLARRRGRREEVELHYDDGSMVTLERGRQGADELLADAAEALAAARGG